MHAPTHTYTYYWSPAHYPLLEDLRQAWRTHAREAMENLKIGWLPPWVASVCSATMPLKTFLSVLIKNMFGFFFNEFAFVKLTSSYSKQLFKLVVETDKRANVFNQVLLRLCVKFRQDFQHLNTFIVCCLKNNLHILKCLKKKKKQLINKSDTSRVDSFYVELFWDYCAVGILWDHLRKWKCYASVVFTCNLKYPCKNLCFTYMVEGTQA